MVIYQISPCFGQYYDNLSNLSIKWETKETFSFKKLASCTRYGGGEGFEFQGNILAIISILSPRLKFLMVFYAKIIGAEFMPSFSKIVLKLHNLGNPNITHSTYTYHLTYSVQPCNRRLSGGTCQLAWVNRRWWFGYITDLVYLSRDHLVSFRHSDLWQPRLAMLIAALIIVICWK